MRRIYANFGDIIWLTGGAISFLSGLVIIFWVLPGLNQDHLSKATTLQYFRKSELVHPLQSVDSIKDSPQLQELIDRQIQAQEEWERRQSKPAQPHDL